MMTVLARGFANSSFTSASSVLTIAWTPGAGTQDVEVIGDFRPPACRVPRKSPRARARSAAASRRSRMALACSNDSRAVPSSAKPVARIVDQRDHRRHVPWPATPVTSGFRVRCLGSGEVRITADHLVDIGNRKWARPTRIVGRGSRALLSRNLVRRVITCSRKATNKRQQVLQVHHLRPGPCIQCQDNWRQNSSAAA